MPDIRIGIGARIRSSFTSTVEEVKTRVREFGSEMDSIVRRATGMSAYEIVLDHIKEKLMEITLGPLASFVVGVGGVNAALWLMDKATEAAAEGLERFSTIEDLEGAFRGLLGGATQARQRLAELAKFAETTPFDLPGTAAASRMLEVLTHGALSTGDGLRLVGDVAAQTGAPLQEIAMWIGRLYDNLQSGRPIGEAMSRLQELGTVTGATRAQIEAMQKAGAAGNDVWKVAKAELDRASGSMAILGQTLSGLKSTYQDTKAALMREVGKSFAEDERVAIKGATEALETMTPVAERAAQVLNDLSIGDTPGQWFPVFDAGLKKIITTIFSAKEAWIAFINVAAAAGVAIAATVTAAALGSLISFIKQTGVALAAVRALTAAAGAQNLVWNLSVGAITANVRALTAQYIAQGRSTTAAYSQAIAVVVLRTAITSLTAKVLELTTALLVNPVTWVALAAAGIYLWVQNLERATNAQAEFAKETLRITSSVQHATEGIITVTDKIKALADAYKELKAAREAYDKAPQGSEEQESAGHRVQAAQLKIIKIERLNDRELKPSDDRQKYMDELNKANMDAYEKGLDPIRALELAQARLNDQIRIQHGLDQQSGKAMYAASTARMADLEEKIAAKKKQLDEEGTYIDSKKGENDTRIGLARFTGGKGSTELIAKLTKESAALELRRKKLQDDLHVLEQDRNDRTATSEAARTAAAQGRAAVGNMQVDVTDATKKKTEYDLKLAEITAEKEIAALEGEGIARAYREHEIRQAMLKVQWNAAIAAKDTAKAEEMNLRTIEGKMKMARELEIERRANAERDRSTAEARTSRLENLAKRERDAALAENKLTPGEHRKMEIEALRRQQKQANDDAADIERRAGEARGRGNEAEADKLDKSAIERRKDADNLTFDIRALENKPEGLRPAADSLAKIGLGGGVAPMGKDPLLAQAEKQTRTAEETLVVLKKVLEGKPNATPPPGRFGR